jgi:hypothetical protein
MSVLRFTITKTERELKKIHELSNGKLSVYIYKELSRLYGKDNFGLCIPCEEKRRKTMIEKNLKLNLPDEVIERIKCHAALLEITPGHLIAKFVLDPKLK